MKSRKTIHLTEAQLHRMIYNAINESLDEEELDEWGMRDINRAKEKAGVWWDKFKNNTQAQAKAIRQGVKDGVNFGGLNSIKQGYNQSLAQSAQRNAEDYYNKKQEGLEAQKMKKEDTPEVQQVHAKYAKKIQPIDNQIAQLQNKKEQLKNAEKEEANQVYNDRKSRLMTRGQAYGNANRQAIDQRLSANNKATEYMNRQRQHLGFEPIQQQQMGQQRLEEAVLDRIVNESVHRMLKKKI